jgi:hypothetical protein
MVELWHGVASRVWEVVEVEFESRHDNLDTGREIVLGCGFKKKVLESVVSLDFYLLCSGYNLQIRCHDLEWAHLDKSLYHTTLCKQRQARLR